MIKEVNPYKCSPWANTFAFHDFETKDIKIHDFLSYVVSLFKEHGLDPTRMGIISSSINSQKMNSFKRELKKLEKTTDESIKGISLDATSFANENIHRERIFSLYFDREKMGDCIIVLDEQFFTFEPEKVQQICQNIIRYLSPCYAYMFRREFKKGPVWYPLGILCGISSLQSFEDYSPEAEFITMWNHKIDPHHSQGYKTGDLRDIYPIQMVMDEHLDRIAFKNMTLRQFIESAPDHGRLEALDDTHYLWWVDESNISDVREKLRPSGIMIAV